MRKYLTKKEKEIILNRQNNKCANSIFNPAINLKDYKCLLWKYQEGYFDDAGYDFDHINEVCITSNNSLDNYQALCPNCHSVKTKKFRKQKNMFTSEEIEYGYQIMEIEPYKKKKSCLGATIKPKELIEISDNESDGRRQFKKRKFNHSNI